MKRAIVLIALLSLASTANADRITMRGTTIPLPETTIERIAAGRVHHVDAQGRPQQIELDRIATLSFDRIPELDEAEAALVEEDYERAVLKFLQALLSAETDVQRVWIRSRLVRVHDALQQYAQAVSHLASIVLIEDHPFWRAYEPVRDPAETFYAAAAEAADRLSEARRRARHPEVIAMLNRMNERVQPIHRRLSVLHDGTSIVRGTTLSGYEITTIRLGELVPAGLPDEEEEDAQPDELIHEEPPPAEPIEHEPGSPGAIEALLASGDFRAAADLCEEIARDPGDRDLAEFLHQYGRALAGLGEHHDAAVMFTRCAILYPGSRHAPASLIETAIIYRDIFNNTETARRLLERAAREADRQGNRETARRARALLEHS